MPLNIPISFTTVLSRMSILLFGPPSRDPISLVLPKEDYYYSVGVVQYTPKKTVESNVISRHKTTQTILASIFLNLETTVIGNRHVIAYSSAYNALPSISHLRASNNMDAHLPFANNRRENAYITGL